MIKKLVITWLFIGVLTLWRPTSAHAEGVFEPIIRVGLSTATLPIEFVSQSQYMISAGGVPRILLPENATATISYSAPRYAVTAGGVYFSTAEALRFIPEVQSATFTIPTLNRTISGHNGRKYQTYRGIFEYRFSPRSQAPYLINELPLEEYLYGLTETAPGDANEYVKAVVAAARSYAYNHLAPFGSNHLFDVYASTKDQLYLGYESELRLPSVAAAAAATRGEFVMYKDKPALTLYFSRSSGKTKSWVKPLRPWLTSVTAIYDKGKRQSGHGYGMSLQDAKERVRQGAWDYRQVLQYYYTSTTVERLY